MKVEMGKWVVVIVTMRKQRQLLVFWTWKISVELDVGPSRGSSVSRPSSEDPNQRERIFLVQAKCVQPAEQLR
jgi:hypothetical protein